MAEDLIARIQGKIDKMKEPILAVIKDCHGEKIMSEIVKRYNTKVEDFGEFYRIYITK